MNESIDVGFGSLGKAREQRSEKSPTHMGSLTLKETVKAGTKLYLAAWVRENDETGEKFFSIKANMPPPRQSSQGAAGQQRIIKDDDIPF